MAQKIKWQGVVVHHTRSHDVSIEVVRQWHKARGWDDVGYHFLIRADGRVEEGRLLTLAGCHARGRNQTHIGVALTGCFSGEPPNHLSRTEPTVMQLDSLLTLLFELYLRFDFQLTNVVRHHALCPGSRLDLENTVKSLLDTRDHAIYEKQILEAAQKIEKQLKTIRKILAKNPSQP